MQEYYTKAEAEEYFGGCVMLTKEDLNPEDGEEYTQLYWAPTNLSAMSCTSVKVDLEEIISVCERFITDTEFPL